MKENVVLKIAYNQSGKEQCIREIELWSKEENRPYLAQIYEGNENYIIMERLFDTKTFLPSQCQEKHKFFQQLSGWNSVHIGVDTAGREKLFDYGDGVNSGKLDKKRFEPFLIDIPSVKIWLKRSKQCQIQK